MTSSCNDLHHISGKATKPKHVPNITRMMQSNLGMLLQGKRLHRWCPQGKSSTNGWFSTSMDIFSMDKNDCLVPFLGAFSPWPHRVARHISHSSCPSVRSLWGIHISWGQDRWFLQQKFTFMAMYNIEMGIESGIMRCIIIHNYLCMSKMDSHLEKTIQ
jgi:hypothetical protein